MSTSMIIFPVVVYAVPAILNAFWYTRKDWRTYRRDLAARSYFQASPSNAFYAPQLHVGDLVEHFILSFLPVFNVIILVFEVVPECFVWVADFVTRVLDHPIVPLPVPSQPKNNGNRNE